MKPEDIGSEGFAESLTKYRRKGMILDCHLTGKLSWRQAVELATFYDATEVLALLQGVYMPSDERARLLKNRIGSEVMTC